MLRNVNIESKWGDLETVILWYRKEKNVQLSKKLNAIRLLLNGSTIEEAANAIGVSKTTIKNWKRLWNKLGKDGLNSKHIGSRSKITPKIKREITKIIEVKQQIDGRTVTGKLIHGYIKKNTK